MLTTEKIEAYIQSLINLTHLTTPESFEFYLNLHGWDKIKQHFDTYIYTSPCEKYVLRIEIDFTEFQHHTFIKQAQKHQDNAFMPKIYWYKEAENISFTFMEYLDDMNMCEIYKHIEASFPQGATYVTPIKRNDIALSEALNILSTGIAMENIQSDVTPKNIMQRPCGQLVIIDPYM
jgi:hypothetical protein